MKLTPELQKAFDDDVIKFEKEILNLKEKTAALKQRFMSESFEPLPENPDEDDYAMFVMEFQYYFRAFSLFPDEEVKDKLKTYKFSTEVFKWFVDIDEIACEIRRLKKIKGLYFLMDSFLLAIRSHVEIVNLVNLIECFGLNVIYNNKDSNVLFKDTADRYRRRRYNELQQTTPKMNWFEKKMNELYDQLEIATNDKELARNVLLKGFSGDTSFHYTILDMFFRDGISERTVYCEFFPLLRLALKDQNLLTESEYYANPEIGYKNYTEYKIARVKKILQKK